MTDDKVRQGRECRHCGENRASMMSRNRNTLDGLDTICRVCDRVRAAAYRTDNPDKGRAYDRDRRARLSARTDAELAEDRAAAHPDNAKRCRAGHTAPVDDFYVNRTKLAGLTDYCRPCHVARVGEHKRGRRVDWWQAHGVSLRCLYCHGPYEHADHVTPLAGGGVDELWALRPSCATCNISKNDRHPLAWMAGRPFLPYSDELAAVSAALSLYGELHEDAPVRWQAVD